MSAPPLLPMPETMPNIVAYTVERLTYRVGSNGALSNEKREHKIFPCFPIASKVIEAMGPGVAFDTPLKARRDIMEYVRAFFEDYLAAEAEHQREGEKHPPLAFHVLVGVLYQDEPLNPSYIVSHSNYKAGKEKYGKAVLFTNRHKEACAYNANQYEIGGEIQVLSEPGAPNSYACLPDDALGYIEAIYKNSL